MTRLVAARDDYDYYAGHLDSTAEHTAYLTASSSTTSRSRARPRKCLAKLRELAELGVDEVSCAYLNGEVEQMERVGREIVPALAGSAA